MRTTALSFVAFVIAAVGCTSPDLPSGQCRYDSDCSSPLKCFDLFCRAECDAAHPCATGQQCISRGEALPGFCVAVLPSRMACLYTSDCPTGTFCTRDGVCQAQCVTDYDCQVINPFHTCVEGGCTIDCAPSTGDCDGDTNNGCETSTARSRQHCGVCGHVCATGQSCVDGACACPTGQTLCGGACVDTRASDAHCGGCNTPCTAGTHCAAGVCARPTCIEGLTRCGEACVNTNVDATNCGSCGNACGADGRCVSGACAGLCPTGLTRCVTGCTDTLTNVNHCGMCGRLCEPANATAECRAGQCAHGECNAGFDDCDDDAANGCEADLSSTAHCGSCGNDCAAPSRHVVGGDCVLDGSAFCTYGMCAPGWSNRNEDVADGCETPIATF